MIKKLNIRLSLFIMLSLITPLIIYTTFVNYFEVPKYLYFIFTVFLFFIIYNLAISRQKKKLLKLNLNIADILILSYTIYWIIRYLFTGKEITSDFLLSFVSLIIFFFLVKNVLQKLIQGNNYNPLFLIITVLLIVCLIELIVGFVQLDKHGISNSLNIIGTFENNGPYSNYIVSIFPIALSGVFLFKNKSKLTRTLSWLIIVGSVIILLIIKTRTAWLGIVLSVLMLIQYKYNIINKFLQVVSNKLIRIVIVLLVLIPTIIAGKYMYKMKEDSSLGRILVWKLTINAIKEKPLFGHGNNTFHYVKNKTQAQYFNSDEATGKEKFLADSLKYTFNDYLQLTSDIGIIGLLLFISIILSFFILFKSVIQKNKDYYFLFFSGFIIILFSALFSYPLQKLSTQINLYLFMAGMSSLNNKNIFEFKIKNRLVFGYSLICIILSLFVLNNIFKKYRAHKSWKQIAYKIQTDYYEGIFNEYKRLYPTLKTNNEFMYNYGVELSIAKKFKESIPILEETKFRLYDVETLVNLANSYKGLRQYKEAEKLYKEASNVIPHTFYPRYCLVLLYDETGNINEALENANTILQMDVKVKSQMVNSIKNEMQVYVDYYSKNDSILNVRPIAQ